MITNRKVYTVDFVTEHVAEVVIRPVIVEGLWVDLEDGSHLVVYRPRGTDRYMVDYSATSWWFHKGDALEAAELHVNQRYEQTSSLLDALIRLHDKKDGA